MTERRSRLRWSLDASASVVTLVVGAVFLFIAWSIFWPRPARPVDETAEALGALRGQSVAVGPRLREKPGAAVVILEFSDFQCPYCRSYTRDVYPTIIKQFVDTGKAGYAFRHLPLESIHGRAFAGSEAAECAGQQERFWEMHDALFTGALSRDGVQQHARTLELDQARFNSCLDGETRATVKADLAEAARLGIMGTPTLLVGTKQPGGRMKVVRALVGAPPLALLVQAIDEATRAVGGD